MDWDPKLLRKSCRDVWLSGVCGGLGETTPLPSWLWRAIFVATTLGIGVGFIAYIALWCFMPAAGVSRPVTTVPGSPSERDT